MLRALGMYAARQTFYIDRDGRVVYIDRDVSTKSAGPQLVERLETLGFPRRENE